VCVELNSFKTMVGAKHDINHPVPHHTHKMTLRIQKICNAQEITSDIINNILLVTFLIYFKEKDIYKERREV
jgi:hypothetical protein